MNERIFSLVVLIFAGLAGHSTCKSSLGLLHIIHIIFLGYCIMVASLVGFFENPMRLLQKF
jgi:hypothetical protein